MSQRERHSRNSGRGSSSSSSNHNNSTSSNASEQTHDVEHQRTGFRILRCFCGCTTLTYDQIEHFAMMNVQTLMAHPTGKKLFENFLSIGHLEDQSESMTHLNCFDMCEKILHNRHLIQDQDFLDEFLSSCPSFVWEERINDAINQSDHDLRQVIRDLKRECVHSIECHNDYDRFRRELLRKIGRSWILPKACIKYKQLLMIIVSTQWKRWKRKETNL